MHILLISTNYLPQLGGVEQVVAQQAQALIAQGHRVTLITSRSGASSYGAEQHGRLTVYRCYLGVTPAIVAAPLALWTRLRLWRALRRQRPDMIHLHFADNATRYALWLKQWLSVPLVVSLHGNDVEKFPKERPIYRNLLRDGLNSADFITACSQDLLQTAGVADQHHAQAVPNGVDTTKFADAPPYQHNRPYLLTVARLVHKKGIDVLIDAVAQLQTDAVDLLVVGDGPERDALEASVKKHQLENRVHFLGRVSPDKIPSLLAGCTLFVLASRQEPFGIVLLEAMAAGKPVVATRVGGVPEFVTDGETGRLVPPDDPIALASAIEQVLENSAESTRLAHTAQQMVEQQYNWAQQTERFLTIYKRCGVSPVAAST